MVRPQNGEVNIYTLYHIPCLSSIETVLSKMLTLLHCGPMDYECEI